MQAKLTQGDVVWKKSPIDEQHPGGCWNIRGCWRSSPSVSTWPRSSKGYGIGQIKKESIQKVSDIEREERQALANKYFCLVCCRTSVRLRSLRNRAVDFIEIFVFLVICFFLVTDFSLHWDGAEHLSFTVSRARYLCFCFCLLTTRISLIHCTDSSATPASTLILIFKLHKSQSIESPISCYTCLLLHCVCTNDEIQGGWSDEKPYRFVSIQKFISIQEPTLTRSNKDENAIIVFILSVSRDGLEVEGKRKECYKGSRRRRREHV